MTEHPILFSDPMVRAILEKRKTQTRRLVKAGRSQKWLTPDMFTRVQRWAPSCDGWWTMAVGEPSRIVHCGREMDGGHIGSVRCPFGQSGDRLWVREAWGFRGRHWNNQAPEREGVSIAYRTDGDMREFSIANNSWDPPRQTCIPSLSRSGREHSTAEHYEKCLTRYWRMWRPSISMPRWASRILLEVTGIRVQRLQDITEEDARAEGVEPVSTDDAPSGAVYRAAFGLLWDSINGQRASWASNPWVFAISFEVLEVTRG